MKILNSTILLTILLFSCKLSYSQCPGIPPLAFTFESTESRCEANGTITLHITGGTPFTDVNGNPIYNNTIIAPIEIPIGGQSDSVFSVLMADTFTVQVADANGCIVTHQVVVPGTYEQLDLIPTWGDAICDGTFGGWICGAPSGGRPWSAANYEYELFDASTNPPTSIAPRGLDSCFTDLAAGSYQIRVYDSCDNFQTRDVLLSVKAYSSVFYHRRSWVYKSCDTACLALAASRDSWGEYPYQWEVIQADTAVSELLGLTGTFDFIDEYDTLCYTPLYTNSSIWIRFTDACGKVGTKSFGLDGFSINAQNEHDCIDGSSLKVYTSLIYRYCDPDSITYELTSGPTGFPLPPPQNTDEWIGLPDGNYCVKVTECCGNVATECESVISPDWFLRIDSTYIGSCTIGWVGFEPKYSTIGGSSRPTGIRTVVTSAPSGYPFTLPDTLNSYVSGPPGNYCVTMYDDCGKRDSLCVDIYKTMFYQTNFEVIPGCVTGNQINFSDSGNINIDYHFNQIAPIFQVIDTYSDEISWTNLNTGTYTAKWINRHNNCVLKTDTIVIPLYQPPVITGAWGIECSVLSTGIIFVQGSGGVPPYSYELFQGPVTIPPQPNTYFFGLPLGTYSMRMTDRCGNSDIVSVAIEPFMPVIQGYGGTFCLGDSVRLYVDYFDFATYSWSGPNGHVSDTSELIIPSISLADTGTYTVDIDIANPDQTACVTQTLTIDLNYSECACVQHGFSVSNLDCFKSKNGSVTAIMTSISGGPFTYQWNNGANTQTISNLQAGTYSVTIADADGCIVTGDTTITSPPQLEVIADVNDISCYSLSDGEVFLTVTGGIPSYTYQWGTTSGGQTSPSATGLSEGIYKVSVTDANGCCYYSSFLVEYDNCTPCELAENSVLDICATLTSNPNHELATQDCDHGGVDNQTECSNGGNPLTPQDDCSIAITSTVDICTIIFTNLNSPLATQDCDNGGVSNIDECNSYTDPSTPMDDCDAADLGGLDICLLIGSDPAHPFSSQDCDEGGIDNYTECTNGGDPTNPSDDCQVAVVADIDICSIIAGGSHPWATLDCDNGGIQNEMECDDGMNPNDPSDDENCPIDYCALAITNGTDICSEIFINPNSPLATLDCDNGGVDNQTECDNGGDPSDPSDDCDLAVLVGTDICYLINNDPTILLANEDCDSGGVPNIDECNNGGDPINDMDDCYSAIDGHLNICQLISYDPAHPLATLDCDEGGVTNWEECRNGGDPNVGSDDCMTAIDSELDICNLLTNPITTLGQEDCDGDGVMNDIECGEGTDPSDPCDFVVISITEPVTADQSECANLCPDLTPITTILPGNIAGVTVVGVAVEITELNGIDTDGTNILVRMPSDPRLAFIWDPFLTIVALTPVNNGNWNYLGDNGVVHTFQYTGAGTIIIGGMTEAFGFESIYDPQNTDGQTTITASIVPFGGGECNILNDTDSERLVYFE